jgi:hypothetical protein
MWERVAMAATTDSSQPASETTIADAILDRLVLRGHRMDLKGKRLRERPEHLS